MVVQGSDEKGVVRSGFVPVPWLDNRSVLSNLVVRIVQHDPAGADAADATASVYVNCESLGSVRLANSPKNMKNHAPNVTAHAVS